MLNQLREKLQNLLSKNSNKINLITQEFQRIEIDDSEDKSIDNTLLIISSILSLILIGITYFNYLKSKDINNKFNYIRNQLSSIDPNIPTESELKSRIEILAKYQELKNSSQKIAPFFEFINEINEFISNENLVSLNYSTQIKKIKYELTINSNSQTFDNDFLNFMNSKFPSKKVEKVSEIKIPNSDITQYKFQGNYEQ